MTAAVRSLSAFTVDLEDWFQGLTSTAPLVAAWSTFASRVVPMTHSLLELLEANQVKATFFTLGYVADEYPTLIERIVAAGHEIGVHGYHHKFVFRLSPDEFAHELDRGIEAIRRATGLTPRGHRAPYFSINASTPWALDVLAARGLVYDSSYHPTRNPVYGFPGAKREPHRAGAGLGVVELPISTVRVGGRTLPFAGGFYLRSWPYWFVRWATRRVHREGLPAIFYVHPWELDLDQPRIEVTPRERISHFHGRGTLRRKLERLFSDFRFVPLADLADAFQP